MADDVRRGRVLDETEALGKPLLSMPFGSTGPLMVSDSESRGDLVMLCGHCDDVLVDHVGATILGLVARCNGCKRINQFD